MGISLGSSSGNIPDPWHPGGTGMVSAAGRRGQPFAPRRGIDHPGGSDTLDARPARLGKGLGDAADQAIRIVTAGTERRGADVDGTAFGLGLLLGVGLG